jgi:hypothetical protein
MQRQQKLGELLARFRDETTKLFEKHGMKVIAYCTPLDEPDSAICSSTFFSIPAAKLPPPTGNHFRVVDLWVRCKPLHQ